MKKIELEYYDIPQKEIDKEGKWASDWDPDEKNYLPDAVRLKMTVERKGKAEHAPEMIVHLNTRNNLNF